MTNIVRGLFKRKAIYQIHSMRYTEELEKKRAIRWRVDVVRCVLLIIAAPRLHGATSMTEGGHDNISIGSQQNPHLSL